MHVSRTGGSSLERLAGVPTTLDQRTAEKGNTDFPGKHATFRDYQKNHAEEFEQFFKFTLIRNPYERLASAWWWRCRVVKDFDCSLYEFASQLPFSWSFESSFKLDHFSFEDSIQQFDFIGRYESYRSDIQAICARTQLDFSKLPTTNQTQRDHYAQYYDTRSLRLVESRFGREIDYFNYRFGE